MALGRFDLYWSHSLTHEARGRPPNFQTLCLFINGIHTPDKFQILETYHNIDQNLKMTYFPLAFVPGLPGCLGTVPCDAYPHLQPTSGWLLSHLKLNFKDQFATS
jgi:hypothetical protein